jgi:hypothetical protein
MTINKYSSAKEVVNHYHEYHRVKSAHLALWMHLEEFYPDTFDLYTMELPELERELNTLVTTSMQTL